MKITKDWLNNKGACKVGYEWWEKQGEPSNPIEIIKLAMKEHFDWANWLIVRVMNKKQCVKYSIYAAEQVIELFEKEYPNDYRPRKAIDAAKVYLIKPCIKTKTAADSAAKAANAAYTAYAAYAANAAYTAHAAYAAAHAAYAAYAAHAAYAANAASAAYAAHAASAAYAAYTAYAAYAANAAGSKLKKQIIEYGIKLLQNK